MLKTARRICPNCGSADEISRDEPLWPHNWSCPNCGHTPERSGAIARLAPSLDGTLSGFDPASFAALAAVERGHFWFEERNALLAWLLKRYAPTPSRVMEIGCGTGFVIGMLREIYPSSRIVGSELHSAGLGYAVERHGDDIEWLQLDARHVFLEGALDVLCACDVLEHIEEDTTVLAAIFRALRPGGILLAAVPQHPWLWSANDDIAHHVRRYRRGELERKATNAGFEIEFSDSFTSVLLPAMAASRLSQRLSRAPAPSNQDIIEKEFRISPGVNAILRKVQRFEHTMRQFGMRLPCGGSRVIVARKRL